MGGRLGSIQRPLPPGFDTPAGIWAAGGLAAAIAAAAAVALGPLALLLPLAALAVAVLVRHPPILLACFLYVGVFKNNAPISSSPVDVTLLLGALLVVVCVHRALNGRGRSLPPALVGLLLLIGLMLAVSLTWTPMHAYGLEKVEKFFTLTSIAMISPFYVIEDRRDVLFMLRTIVVLAVIGAFESVAHPSHVDESQQGRLQFGGNENTIMISRLLCTAGLVLIVVPMLGLPHRLRMVAPAIGAGLVIVAFAVGSRGPVISLAFALVCVLAASVVKRPRQLIYVLVVVAMGLALFPLIRLPETSAQRLHSVVNQPVETFKEDGRSRLYGKATELWRAHPFVGFGSGGFFLYSYTLLNQEEKYPHNVFLELAAEVGSAPPLALALALLSVMLALGRRLWREQDEQGRRLLLAVAGFLLINLFSVQFSGDVNDNRTFWAAFGLAWLFTRHGVPAIPKKAEP